MKKHNDWNLEEEESRFFKIAKRILFYTGCAVLCIASWGLAIVLLCI